MTDFTAQDKKNLQEFLDWYKEADNHPGTSEASLDGPGKLCFRASYWASKIHDSLVRLCSKHAVSTTCTIESIKNLITEVTKITGFMHIKGDVTGLQRAFDSEGISYGKFFEQFRSPYFEPIKEITPAQMDFLVSFAQLMRFKKSPDGEAQVVCEHGDNPILLSIVADIIRTTVVLEKSIKIPEGAIDQSTNGVLRIPADLVLEIFAVYGVDERDMEKINRSFMKDYKKYKVAARGGTKDDLPPVSGDNTITRA